MEISGDTDTDLAMILHLFSTLIKRAKRFAG